MTTKLYNRYYDGTLVRLSASFADLDGNPADPTTVTVRVRNPSTDVSTSYSPTKDATGEYHFDLDTTDYPEGTWYYKWIGTGIVTAASQYAFIINHEEA